MVVPVTCFMLSPGGKPKLHLVVLGHVDAGKSTLMGRLLYELGRVSESTVHKAQVRVGNGGRNLLAHDVS